MREKITGHPSASSQEKRSEPTELIVSVEVVDPKGKVVEVSTSKLRRRVMVQRLQSRGHPRKGKLLSLVMSAAKIKVHHLGSVYLAQTHNYVMSIVDLIFLVPLEVVEEEGEVVPLPLDIYSPDPLRNVKRKLTLLRWRRCYPVPLKNKLLWS